LNDQGVSILNVLLIIFGVLVLLLLVPIGVDVEYSEGRVRLYFRIAWFTRTVYPTEKKADKTKKPKKTKKKQTKKKSLDVEKDEILDGISLVIASLKKLRFSVHRLKLHFISAFPDPYQTAMVYGYACAAVNTLDLANRKNADVQLAVDFEEEQYYLDIYLSVTIRIYYILKFAVCLAVGAIPLMLRRRKRIKTKENSTAVKGKVA